MLSHGGGHCCESQEEGESQGEGESQEEERIRERGNGVGAGESVSRGTLKNSSPVVVDVKERSCVVDPKIIRRGTLKNPSPDMVDAKERSCVVDPMPKTECFSTLANTRQHQNGVPEKN